ncbi:hypothetical protein ACFL4B_01850 [Candidatus Neomarinimicrobiota bacterium]
MKYLKLFILFLIVIFLANCSTPYQPKGALGGYSEEKILDNLYRVEFEGNQHSKLEKIQNYLMYRSAELTKEKGFDYFVIVSEERHFDEHSFRPERNVPFETKSSRSGISKTVANPDLQNNSSSTNYTGVYTIKFLEFINDKYKNAVFNVDEVMKELSEIIKK